MLFRAGNEIRQIESNFGVRVSDKKAKRTLNRARMLFLASLISIEDVIAGGAFDASKLQATIGKYSSEKFRLPISRDPQASDFSYGSWLQMVYAAEKDKTLSTFFEGDLNLLPPKLVDLITGNKIWYKEIKEKVLPQYKVLAEEVCK